MLPDKKRGIRHPNIKAIGCSVNENEANLLIILFFSYQLVVFYVAMHSYFFEKNELIALLLAKFIY